MRRHRKTVAVVVVTLTALATLAAVIGPDRTPDEPPRAEADRPAVSLSPMPPRAITVAAAGDICPPQPDSCARTAELVERLDPDAVFALGDNQYEEGSIEEYLGSYDSTWGRFASITYPVPGNHEWKTEGAAGFLEYFDRSTTWYAFSLGRWRVYALDGSCEDNGGCAPGDPQYEWLADQLDGRTDRCILGFWHQPRFSSGSEHGSDELVAPLWELLEAAGGDVVLNGHEHHYERFARQNGDGLPSADGMVEFVVGTGGTPRAYPFGDAIENSEARRSGFGVLELGLLDDGWVGRFVRPSGAVDDRASGSC